MRKTLKFVECFSVRANPAAGEIEGDGGEASAGQPLGQRRKHSPVLEPLESVADDHRRPARARRSRSNFTSQRPAIRTGQPEWCLANRGHAVHFPLPSLRFAPVVSVTWG